MVNPSRVFVCCTMCLMVVTLFAACGGKLAKTGCAVVTDVGCNGEMRVHYQDGNVRWKRVDPANFNRDMRIVQQNCNTPGKYVETKSGGTLTFPDGKTIVYHDTQ